MNHNFKTKKIGDVECRACGLILTKRFIKALNDNTILVISLKK